MSTITDIRELHDAPLPEEHIQVQSLVEQVIDAFATAGDLYRVLKERADSGWKEIEKVKKSPDREVQILERIEYRTLDSNGREKRDSGYVDAEETSIGEGAAMIGKEFDRGIRDIGEPFAHGDSIGQIKIQTEVIALQKTTIAIYATCFAHLGRERPIAQHISRLMSRVRMARKHCLDALEEQYQRMFIPPPASPSEIHASLARSSRAPSLSRAAVGPTTKDNTTTVARSKSLRSHRSRGDIDRPSSRDRSSPRTSKSVKSVVIQRAPSPIPSPPPPTNGPPMSTALVRQDSDMITTKDGPTSSSPSTIPNPNRSTLFCIYALDLQDHVSQPLSASYSSSGNGLCPYCSTHIRTTPGRTWEIYKEGSQGRRERVFHIENRFVVKSHREGGGFACALCARGRDADTVMEDVRSLVDHVWREHGVEEYEREVDIREVA